mmetsp:Transcript_145789/g.467156  ORF Transcript_145789/g.467156 Transcript_145789/m.467156 type:complete len:549 (-) Transcript_145789:329-1975(-)
MAQGADFGSRCRGHRVLKNLPVRSSSRWSRSFNFGWQKMAARVGARLGGLFLVLLPGVAQSAGAGVLRLDGDGAKPQNFAAVYAEWSRAEGKLTAEPVVRPRKDAYGCKQYERCPGCAIFVLQGNCTFAKKASLAKHAGAAFLIVAKATDGPPAGMAEAPIKGRTSASEAMVDAVMVSKAAGRKVLLALDKGESLSVTVFPKGIVADILSEVFVGVLAVGLVMLGAWHSVEDLRRPELKAKFDEEVVAVEEHSGFHFVLFGSVMLTVLFFFMKYLIYILLFLFATGAVSTTTMLLEPLISNFNPALRARHAFSLPARLADWIGFPRDHNCAEALAEGVGSILAVAFLLYRNNDSFGWALQDVIAIMLLLTIQRTLRLPNLKTGTLMLVCTFFFDIFWVFLSPLIFKKSVMIEVATGGGTGQSVPMVLKIPSDVPGQFKILGLGDIAIPGLLISLLLRHDLIKGYPRFGGYFAAGVFGYTLGLAATFVSLYLMQHGQPALLFLVPGTLLPTVFIALRKGELRSLWTASYGPEVPPEGYQVLADEAGKRD